MDVYLTAPRGFCAGVVRAVDIVEIALERYRPPVYVKHEIVHNPYVVADLESKGAVTVDDVADIPAGSVVVFSAHGSPPSDYEAARARNLKVVDATCPLVTRVHNEAKKYEQEGRRLLLVGHRGHQEVKGTTGHAAMVVLDDRERPELPGWEADQPVAVLTQTTLSVDDTASMINRVTERFHDVTVRNDICYATTNRQEAAKALAAKVQVVFVVGSQTSSNCKRLREVARNAGAPAYLINGPEGIDPAWHEGVDRVGITSGASTPESLVQRVCEALRPDRVVNLEMADEDITFTLPPEMRDAVPPRRSSAWETGTGMSARTETSPAP